MTQDLMPVTQADREAAADTFQRVFAGQPFKGQHAALYRDGKLDGEWLAQAFARHRTTANAELVEALDILKSLSSYLGAGIGDETTTAAEYDRRIRWGIDHVGGVYRQRAADVVEQMSKLHGKTWGDVKRAILDDTALPTTLIAKHKEGEA